MSFNLTNLYNLFIVYIIMKLRVVKAPIAEGDAPALSRQFFEKFNLEDKLEVTFKGHLEAEATENPDFCLAKITEGSKETFPAILKGYKFILTPQKDILLTLNLNTNLYNFQLSS